MPEERQRVAKLSAMKKRHKKRKKQIERIVKRGRKDFKSGIIASVIS